MPERESNRRQLYLIMNGDISRIMDEVIEGSKDMPLSSTQRPIKPLIEAVHETLASLTPRQKEVLILSFGLKHGVEMTHREIADEIGCSIRAVRRTKRRALRKLFKNKDHRERLREFLE